MVDVLIVGILLVSGLIAVARGFIREALGVASWIAATFAALYGYPYFAPLFEDFTDNKTITEVAAGVSISIVTLVICTFIISFICKKVQSSCLNGLDMILGFFFGLLRGWLIILLLYVLGLIVFPVQLQNQQEESRTLPYVADSFSVLEKVIPSELNEEITKRMQEAKEQTEKRRNEEKESIVPKPKKNDNVGYDNKERESMNALVNLLSSLKEETGKSKSKATDKSEETEKPTGTWAKSESSVKKYEKGEEKQAVKPDEDSDDNEESEEDESEDEAEEDE